MSIASIYVSKFFAKKFTRISINANFLNSKSNMILSNVLVQNKTKNNSYNLDINSSLSKYFNIELSSLLAFFKNNGAGFNSKSRSYTQGVHIYIIPSSSHNVNFSYDFQSKTSDNNTFSANLFDLAYQFTVTKRKLDFELKLNNLFNQKQITEIATSYFADYFNQIQIRKRQIVFTVKMNL